MASRVILDANFLIAQIDASDLWHKKATELSLALDTVGALCLYLDCVMIEVISVLARRASQKKKSFSKLADALSLAIPRERITWLSPTLPRFYDETLALVRTHRGELSFNDALMILAAREMGVFHIVSFDKDFDHVEGIERISSLDAITSL